MPLNPLLLCHEIIADCEWEKIRAVQAVFPILFDWRALTLTPALLISNMKRLCEIGKACVQIGMVTIVGPADLASLVQVNKTLSNEV